MKKVILPLCFAFLISCGGTTEEGVDGANAETAKKEEVKIEPCYPENFAVGSMIKKDSVYQVNIHNGKTYATIFSNGAAFIVLTDKDLPESPDKAMFDKLDQAAITIKLDSDILTSVPNQVVLGADSPGYQIFYSQLGMNDYLSNKYTKTFNDENGVSQTEVNMISGTLLIEKANENQICITADLIDPDGQKLKFSISSSVTPR